MAHVKTHIARKRLRNLPSVRGSLPQKEQNRPTINNSRPAAFCASLGWLTVRLGVIFFLLSISVYAASISEYDKHIAQAIAALDSLAQIANENETIPAYEARTAETISSVQQLLPAKQTVEVDQQNFAVDNSWLQTELEKYKTASATERPALREQTIQRLQAILDRVKEIETASAGAPDKQEQNRKLAEILQRPEYARKAKQETAIGRLLRQLIKWLQNLFPKPKPVSPGLAGIFTKIAQVFVIVLALAVLVFVGKLFLPRLLQARRAKRTVKTGARIVMGERLEPDQSAKDLLSEAELLARNGDLRAAIRKAYIALLVELGDRNIITLAQHKTNRDYLRAVRGVAPLYPNMKQLTESFERHWYGLALPTESDWQSFRSGYQQALATRV